MATAGIDIVAMAGCWVSPALVAPLAIGIGYVVGKMPCWESWQGYVGPFIVAPLVVVAGIDAVEAVIDCVALACGFALARRAML